MNIHDHFGVAAYADLSNKSSKECRLYERDLERAMESCDNLTRENDNLRTCLNQIADGEVSTDSVNMDKLDSASTVMDEEDDVGCSLHASPAHSVKDHTSIDDIEIMKHISCGAFGLFSWPRTELEETFLLYKGYRSTRRLAWETWEWCDTFESNR